MKKILALIALMAACGSPKKNSDASQSSELTSVSVKLPNKSGFREGARLDGYMLEIRPTSGLCEGVAPILNANEYTSQPISNSLRQGCGYRVVLELGKLNAAKSALEPGDIYFSNRILGGFYINSSDTEGKTFLSLTLGLTVTARGTELGFGPEGTEITTPAVDVNAEIAVTFVPRITTAEGTCQGLNVQINESASGVEFTSSQEASMYCMVSVKVAIPYGMQIPITVLEQRSDVQLVAGKTGSQSTSITFLDGSSVTAFKSLVGPLAGESVVEIDSSDAALKWGKCSSGVETTTIQLSFLTFIDSVYHPIKSGKFGFGRGGKALFRKCTP